MELKIRRDGDISSVFATLAGDAEEPLPARFADIKKQIIKDPAKVRASWLRLKESLQHEIDAIDAKGSAVIPSIKFADLDNPSTKLREEILTRGCVIVRNVFSREEARGFKDSEEAYIRANPTTKGFPAKEPVVYELYWSKPQVTARADRRLDRAMNFVNSLWHADPGTQIDLNHNVVYADRLRIRQPGDAQFTLGPHIDGGSLERWENDEYRACYQSIWDGQWEDYDAYDATHRVTARMDLYESAGFCSIFRSFQGWVSLSDGESGHGSIRFAPLVKQVTAYLMLRPFFDEKDNIDFESTIFHGARPGRGHEMNTKLHPGLDLDRLMVGLPKVHPGDAVFWHCDLIHSVDAVHKGTMDSSVLYIPAAPLCPLNARYAAVQRECFERGIPPPDFPGYPNGVGESKHTGRADDDTILSVGGVDALRSMGLKAFSSANDSELYSEINGILGF